MAPGRDEHLLASLFPGMGSKELTICALHSAPHALMVVSGLGRVFYVNRKFEELTVNTLSEIKDRELTSLCFLARESQAVPKGADSWEGEIGWPNASGQVLWLHITSVCLSESTEDQLGYVLSFRALGDAGERTMQDPRQQRLESLGSLAGGIAHDLNNVLTGVLGHVSFLRLSLAKEGTHIDSLVAIEDGARRAASMTQQILEFARGAVSERRGVNLSMVIGAGVNLLRAALPKNVIIEVSGGEKDVFVFGDESQLSQLVMNLAVNARDALPNGGKIRVQLTEVEVNDLQSSLAPGPYAQLEIRDNGVGIPQEIRGRIFEPFFTTKPDSGTGLGLATVFAIVQRHGGLIELESEEGKGTCFRVLLPTFINTEATEEPEVDDAEAKLPTGSERILVIDDEEAVRLVIQRSLEHLGYSVDIAEDGPSAIAQYLENMGQYNLIILDMMMPKMPGDEVFHRLKSYDPHVPVLIASGYSSDHRTKAILDAGGLGFLKKPFAVEELAREVRRCLDLREPGDSAV